MDKFSLIANHLSDGVMEIDEKGIIVYCNKKAADLDGIAIADVLGKPLLAVYPSLKRNTSTLYKVLKTGEPIVSTSQTFVTYKGKTIATVNTTLPIKVNGIIRGAVEISRDVTDVKDMSETIADLQRRVHQHIVGINQSQEEAVRFSFDDIVTVNTHMVALKEKALKVAKLDQPVLVIGETGTGKELFVQAIHKASPRAKAPFIAQNCAALPLTLLEGILFGTVEGAYTGAKDRIGLLETAHGGTIFLDEINSMPLELQAKLLRFLQDGWLRKVGDNQSIKVDVRVIAATNMPLQEAMDKGYLRKDLYYRLNTAMLDLPALKHRTDDLALLTDHFILRFNKKYKKSVRGVTDDVMQVFSHYSWPGNVRELEHILEGIISMTDEVWITGSDLPQTMKQEGIGPSSLVSPSSQLKEALAQLEEQMIRQAMVTSANNVTEAARKLGLPRQTLQYKLSKLDH